MISPHFGPANVVRHGMLTIISLPHVACTPQLTMTERGEAMLEQIKRVLAQVYESAP